jgi:hypothetical protein
MHSEKQNILEEYIRANRLRPSWQRLIILEIFLEFEQGISATDLYVKLKSSYPGTSIGQATVFRTLKLFVSSGIAISNQETSGPFRFLPDESRPLPLQQANPDETTQLVLSRYQNPNRSPKPARVATPRHTKMTAAIPCTRRSCR